jgi:hypothetical protein
MPFLWDWIWKKLNGTSETPTQPQVLDAARVDDKVREEIVRDRRALPTKKSNPSTKPSRVRSNNASKAGGKGAGKTVRAPATKGKSKSKTVQKG